MKTDDGKECYNPLHWARAAAAKKLKHVLAYAGCKVEHVYSDECSEENNQLWD